MIEAVPPKVEYIATSKHSFT